MNVTYLSWGGVNLTRCTQLPLSREAKATCFGVGAGSTGLPTPDMGTKVHRIPCCSSDFRGFVPAGSPSLSTHERKDVRRATCDGIDVRLEQQLHAGGSYGRHLLPGGDPNLSMGLYETTWDSTPAAGAMGLFERRRRGRVAMCLGSSRRSSRGTPTQEI